MTTMNQVAELILINHQRHRGGCLCGWAELGKSHPGHQVAMLRDAGVLAGYDCPDHPGPLDDGRNHICRMRPISERPLP